MERSPRLPIARFQWPTSKGREGRGEDIGEPRIGEEIGKGSIGMRRKGMRRVGAYLHKGRGWEGKEEMREGKGERKGRRGKKKGGNEPPYQQQQKIVPVVTR